MICFPLSPSILSCPTGISPRFILLTESLGRGRSFVQKEKNYLVWKCTGIKFELINLIKGGSSTSGCFKPLFNITNSAI